MNQELTNAIKLYCSMLPYINYSAQPNDDKRLYTISYHLVKSGERLDEDFFKQELRKNSHAGLNILIDEEFEKFAANRIKEIQSGRYILDIISNLIFPNN